MAVNYKPRMEKRLEITLKQNYVTRITTMLNSGMIPTGKRDIIRRFLQGQGKRFGLGKIKAGMVSASSAAK